MFYHTNNILYTQEPFSQTDKNMFHASNGWLSRLCNRTGFKSRAIYGEKGSADEIGAETFFKQFNTFLAREFNF